MMGCGEQSNKSALDGRDKGEALLVSTGSIVEKVEAQVKPDGNASSSLPIKNGKKNLGVTAPPTTPFVADVVSSFRSYKPRRCVTSNSFAPLQEVNEEPDGIVHENVVDSKVGETSLKREEVKAMSSLEHTILLFQMWIYD
ncbi:hypothetical protein L6452_09252 [Arctium lappa]|uniref:Uncharacterized protein n=1 Tax=Arctium lappa TaxID=4217 RepID=A0ACB9DK36_ARCLA|nr:hypothetical protein L6452_09252 [Arctium lappa]